MKKFLKRLAIFGTVAIVVFFAGATWWQHQGYETKRFVTSLTKSDSAPSTARRATRQVAYPPIPTGHYDMRVKTINVGSEPQLITWSGGKLWASPKYQRDAVHVYDGYGRRLTDIAGFYRGKTLDVSGEQMYISSARTRLVPFVYMLCPNDAGVQTDGCYWRGALFRSDGIVVYQGRELMLVNGKWVLAMSRHVRR